MATVTDLGRERWRRRVDDLIREADAARAEGDEGAVAGLLDVVRVIQQFELGEDTGMGEDLLLDLAAPRLSNQRNLRRAERTFSPGVWRCLHRRMPRGPRVLN